MIVYTYFVNRNADLVVPTQKFVQKYLEIICSNFSPSHIIVPNQFPNISDIGFISMWKLVQDDYTHEDKSSNMIPIFETKTLKRCARANAVVVNGAADLCTMEHLKNDELKIVTVPESEIECLEVISGVRNADYVTISENCMINGE